jgi:hypothetical protein
MFEGRYRNDSAVRSTTAVASAAAAYPHVHVDEFA